MVASLRSSAWLSTTIYLRMALGSFPGPRKIGARSVWVKADIDRFCAEVATPESGA
ncbi:helix-turn-helix transcriptional regulator [Stenotrophomonas maltophilia]